MGSYRLVMMLSMYTSCMLYSWLTAVCIDIGLPTSDCVLHHILTASGFTSNFEMCSLGHTFGGCIGSVMMDQMVSALLLCLVDVALDEEPVSRLDSDLLAPC